MNRKVEQRVVAGFEPGAHSPRAQAEPARPSRHQPRHPQRHGQGAPKKHGHSGKAGAHSHQSEPLTREQERKLREAYSSIVRK